MYPWRQHEPSCCPLPPAALLLPRAWRCGASGTSGPARRPTPHPPGQGQSQHVQPHEHLIQSCMPALSHLIRLPRRRRCFLKGGREADQALQGSSTTAIAIDGWQADMRGLWACRPLKSMDACQMLSAELRLCGMQHLPAACGPATAARQAPSRFVCTCPELRQWQWATVSHSPVRLCPCGLPGPPAAAHSPSPTVSGGPPHPACARHQLSWGFTLHA